MHACMCMNRLIVMQMYPQKKSTCTLSAHAAQTWAKKVVWFLHNIMNCTSIIVWIDFLCNPSCWLAG
jgi:hypothetical protein